MGKSAIDIARMEGISVLNVVKVLIGEVTSVGEEEPFAHPKPFPVLAFYKAATFEIWLNLAE